MPYSAVSIFYREQQLYFIARTKYIIKLFLLDTLKKTSRMIQTSIRFSIKVGNVNVCLRVIYVLHNKLFA